MIGPFKPAPGNFKCVFVLIDKFSKWIEYMPLTKASSEKAVEFLDQTIHHFGLPNRIITDLGTQFTGNAFWDFCDERSIVVKFMLVAHPRANGQVKRANGMILDTLKKRLYRENDKAPRRWLKELLAANPAQSQHWRLPILHGLQRRSSTPYRYRFQITTC
jgi:transposase InsO family protein